MPDPHFEARPFAELTTTQLFDLLVLRSEVFVVEQNCVYLDPDEWDPRSCHLLGYLDSRLIATARWFEDEEHAALRLGRVVTAPAVRGRGYGRAAIEETLKRVGHRPIFIHGQTYLEPFYRDFGFARSGPDFLEDGIPHLPMRREPPASSEG